MRWAEMSVQCLPDASDAVSYAFLEAGCGGVMTQGSETLTVTGSLPVTDELSGKINELMNHLDRLPEFGLSALVEGLTLRYAEDEDWANAWKQYFKPIKLGKRLVIKPSWEEYAAQGDELIIELDPGMAFGTGAHPTTQLCLRAMELLVKPGMTVADIGTGSGILALAAARLGATSVFATDIDILPRKIARENIAHNQLQSTIQLLEMDEFDLVAHDCDVVIANIIANTIIELAPEIAARIKPNGIFIASGIVEEHHDTVKDALAAVGLNLLQTLRDDIWVCLVARHEATAKDDAALARASAELPPLGDQLDWAA